MLRTGISSIDHEIHFFSTTRICIGRNGLHLKAQMIARRTPVRIDSTGSPVVVKAGIETDQECVIHCAGGCYQLKTPYRDGPTHVVCEPLDSIAHLAAWSPNSG